MSKLDTHFYDHKLAPPERLKEIRDLPKEQKAQVLEELQVQLNADPSSDPKAQRNLQTILHDFHHNPQRNYDSSNQLRADDLLYLASELLIEHPESDLIKLLNQQLCEMSSGMCPQGRTHRLYQVLVSFMPNV